MNLFLFLKKNIYMYMLFKMDFRSIYEVYLFIIKNYDLKCGLI